MSQNIPKNTIPPASFWQEHRLNLLLAAGIFIVSVLVVGYVNDTGSRLKSDLINISQDTLNLSAGQVGNRNVELLWDEPAPPAGSYTGQVGYDIKYYTGELTTRQMIESWNLFEDIHADHTGITENVNDSKRVIATELQPNTRYTFGVLKQDGENGLQEVSNALTVNTRSVNSAASGAAASHAPGVAVDPENPIGDVNRDGRIASDDAYAIVMYKYFQNWPAYLVAMQTQGVFDDISLTQATLESLSDTNRDCMVNFDDAELTIKRANGVIPAFPETENNSCEYGN